MDCLGPTHGPDATHPHHTTMLFSPVIRSIFFSARAGLVGAAMVVLAGTAGCAHSHGDPVPVDVSAGTITYAKVVSPLFDVHCRQCHGSSVAATLGGNNDFGSYLTIKRYPAASLLGSIEQAPGYDPMPKGRAKVPAADIQRIKEWFAAGAPDN